MSILGMGSLEILVVLLVGFIFLGPERMVSVARTLGKVVAEARRMTAELPELMEIADDGDRASQAGAGAGEKSHPTPKTTDATERTDEAGETAPDAEGPVAFRPGESQTPTPEETPSRGQEG